MNIKAVIYMPYIHKNFKKKIFKKKNIKSIFYQ